MKTFYTVYDITPDYNNESAKLLVYKDDFDNKLDALQYVSDNAGTSFKLTILETYE